MRRGFIYLTSILIAGVFSCKSQVKTQQGPQPTKDPTIYKGVTDQSCAVEVSFGSYSAGIDGKTLDKIVALISENKLKYTAKNIGREGETRLCLPLTGFKGKKKDKLKPVQEKSVFFECVFV